MILVKTYIGPSSIHGLGVFAQEFIAQGTKVWEITPGMDLEWKPTEFIDLPYPAQQYIQHWGYQDPDTLNYRLSFDNDRFMNWSTNPNILGSSTETFAVRDIDKDEELTYPYAEDLLGNNQDLKHLT
mgnify:FL=1|jgi:SET domain-containing protein